MLPRVDPDVIFKPLADGGVLFHPRSEVYFGLNETGAVAWQLLATGVASMDDLSRAMKEKYPDADEPTLHRDLVALIDDLGEYGLLQASDGIRNTE